jgi:hypothetical protein
VLAEGRALADSLIAAGHQALPDRTSCPPSRSCHSSHASLTSPGKTVQSWSQRPPGWLAAMAILVARDNLAMGNGTDQLTSPAETAGLIEQPRTADITLTYDPDTQTIRIHGSDPVAVTASRDR